MEISSYYPVVYTPLNPAEKSVTPVESVSRNSDVTTNATRPVVQQQMIGQLIAQTTSQRYAQDMPEKSKAALQAYTYNGREQEKKQLSDLFGVDEFA